jgi:hypothetical protein
MKGEMNMKEKYTAPEMEIIEFESEDVITTSPPATPDVNI